MFISYVRVALIIYQSVGIRVCNQIDVFLRTKSQNLSQFFNEIISRVKFIFSGYYEYFYGIHINNKLIMLYFKVIFTYDRKHW